VEDAHIEKPLRVCGYPDWTFRKVRDQMIMNATKRKRKNGSESWHPIVLEDISERVARVMKRHWVPVTNETS